MSTLISIDDLHHEMQILKYLLPMWEERPALIVNCYAVPNKMGPVHDLKEKYPFIQFCIHGFEHSQFEALTWTSDLAAALLTQAVDMGYEKVFKAPNYAMDQETEQACNDLGIGIHTDESYRCVIPGTRYFDAQMAHDLDYHGYHIQAYPGCQDFLGDNLEQFHKIIKAAKSFTTTMDALREVGK